MGVALGKRGAELPICVEGPGGPAWGWDKEEKGAGADQLQGRQKQELTQPPGPALGGQQGLGRQSLAQPPGLRSPEAWRPQRA